MRHLVFRDIETLTNLSHPYVKEFKSQHDAFHPGLWSCLERVPDLDANVGRALLNYLLSLACRCQNTLNIELGRAGLLALPKGWLLRHIEEAVGTLLRVDDEWEYRRLLEVCWKIDDELVRRFALDGIERANGEVREISDECLKELGDA